VRRFLLVLALLCLICPASAGAAVQLGVVGSKARFRDLTGQRSHINLVFTSWNTGVNSPTWLDGFLADHGPIPMVSFGTKSTKGAQVVTPRGIANGRGDAYLIALSNAIGRYGRTIYVRPLAEMNAYWNVYSAYNANGTSRGAAYSTAAYRDAFRRMFLILHGGLRSDINARLANRGMPALRSSSDLPLNTFVRLVWNPQGYGSPNIRRNRANAYYPGDGFVDVVANDLYDQNYHAAWDANYALFKSHPGKPYAIGEWGLWGIDDPAFIRRMASFVKGHGRVEAIVYYKSAAGSIFDLGNKPRSRAAYRNYIVPLGG
jgi:hypothetical protein